MKKFALLLFPALTISVFADNLQPTGAMAYININTGISTLSNLPTSEWTVNTIAGYNLSNFFAVEAGYNLFTGSQYGGANVTTNIFDAAAKGTIPISNTFSIFGKAGIGLGNNSWTGSVNSTGCALCNSSLSTNYSLALFGVGGTYTISKNVDLLFQDTAYVPFNNTYTGTINAITLGVQYNF